MQHNAAEFPWTRKRERAVLDVAEDVLTNEQIASKLGVNRSTLDRWKMHPEFRLRVQEHLAATREAIRAEGIAHRQNRVDALHDRWDKLQQVIDARGDEYDGVTPGGGTGLIVRQIKSIGVGENNQVVEEYVIDTGLLSEMRAHEKQAAQELGQWTEKREHIGIEGSDIRVSVIDYRAGVAQLRPPDSDDAE